MSTQTRQQQLNKDVNARATTHYNHVLPIEEVAAIPREDCRALKALVGAERRACPLPRAAVAPAAVVLYKTCGWPVSVINLCPKSHISKGG